MARRKFKLRINGKINGKDFTPETIPLGRLAEYLSDFADLLGYREHVHFQALEDGSAMPVAWAEMEKESAIRERVKQASNGLGPIEATSAVTRLQRKFIDDNGSGEILETIGKDDLKLIVFPGRNKELSPVYGPFKEHGSVQGQLRRVGGAEPTIPVHLVDDQGEQICCYANVDIAKQLAPYLFQNIRASGVGDWERDENGKWKMLEFEIQSYKVLSEDDLTVIVDKLRGIPGSEWDKFSDPLEELRRIRHGEDEIQ